MSRKLECKEKFLDNPVTRYLEIGIRTLSYFKEIPKAIVLILALIIISPLWIVGFVAEKSGLIEVIPKEE